MTGRETEKAVRLQDALAGEEGLVFAEKIPLGRLTTLRIGGPARLYVEVGSEPALSALLRKVEELSLPFFLLGVGSNILVPDAGFAGVVAKLAGRLREVRFEGARVQAGGAVQLSKLARETLARGLVGLESLAGFPSTVGGAVRMNAGSYGTEIADLLISVRVVDRSGKSETLAVDELEAEYRSTKLQRTGHIVTEALFDLRRGDAEPAKARMQELADRRWQSLPAGVPNAGSIFRNTARGPAGKLIDECGLKGTSAGGARISPKHGNVIVNTGGATAADVIDLMVRMHDAVAAKYGVSLAPEVVLVGELEELWRRRTAAARSRLAFE